MQRKYRPVVVPLVSLLIAPVCLRVTVRSTLPFLQRSMKHTRHPFLMMATWAMLGIGLQTTAMAQAPLPCGQNAAQAAFDAQHAGEMEARKQREAAVREAASALIQRGAQDDEVYTIPVVFHVIHQNGPENISNEQIFDALEVLNRDFRRLNADTSQIVAGFVDLAADIDVEFRLAKRDPNGDCHPGINRIESPLTYEGNNEMKQLIHWPRWSYLNVYVCADAAGAAGYTNYPSDWGASTDGIVLKHEYVVASGRATPTGAAPSPMNVVTGSICPMQGAPTTPMSLTIVSTTTASRTHRFVSEVLLVFVIWTEPHVVLWTTSRTTWSTATAVGCTPSANGQECARH